MASQLAFVLQRRILHPVGKIGLEPASPLRAYAQITACFPVDPVAEVDPFANFLRPFPVPRHIFA
ncbi:hypothetical protein D3C71_2195450 [compost metagenome]